MGRRNTSQFKKRAPELDREVKGKAVWEGRQTSRDLGKEGLLNFMTFRLSGLLSPPPPDVLALAFTMLKHFCGIMAKGCWSVLDSVGQMSFYTFSSSFASY